MLKVKNTHLLEEDLSSSFFEQYEDDLPLLKSISEKANWSIDEILSSISQQTIEDCEIRNNFRRYLIAKKYGIKERPSFSYSSSCVKYVSDLCIIIDSIDSDTSIVMDALGKIKTYEGKVYINISCFFYTGSFRSFGMGEQKNKCGLYSIEGNEILPCIFDFINNKDFPLELFYKELQFEAWFVEKTEIDNLPYRRKDSVLYTFDGGLVLVQYDKFDTSTLQRIAPGVTLSSMPEKKVPDPKELNEMINSAFSELDREMEAAGHHRYIIND